MLLSALTVRQQRSCSLFFLLHLSRTAPLSAKLLVEASPLVFSSTSSRDASNKD